MSGSCGRQRSLATLLLFLIAIPAFLTYLHLRHELNRKELCLVGPSSSGITTKSSALLLLEEDSETNTLSLYYGLYEPNQDKKNKSKDKRSFVQHPPERTAARSKWYRYVFQGGYPSAALVANSLMPRRRKRKRRRAGFEIRFEEAEQKWCLYSTKDASSLTLCDSSDTVATSAIIRQYPPSGLYALSSTASPAISVRVSCTGPPTIPLQDESTTTSTGSRWWWLPKNIRRNPNKKQQQKSNKHLQQIMDRPATTLLLMLNLYLAFVYWNAQTSPSAVAKIYNAIFSRGQVWRSLSGATAHFEPIHLLFNMMSLYSLGHELEDNDLYFDSLEFLQWNLSLIVLCTIVMMILISLQIRHSSNSEESSTVGYSGVLFAWMVITSLERSNTCPVPFLPDLCFDTYELLGVIKVNMSPLVQLLLCQCIMPRASFVGHLSGIICGFLLHWGLLPMEVSCPQVLVPIVLLLCWRFLTGFCGHEDGCNRRKILPVRNFFLNGEKNEIANVVESRVLVELGVRQGNNEEEEGMLSWGRKTDTRKHSFLVFARNVMFICSVVSFGVLDPFGSMVMAQSLATCFVHFGVQSNAILLQQRPSSLDDDEYDDLMGAEKKRWGTIWRGTALMVVLLIVTDTMAIPAWIVGRVYLPTERRLVVGMVPVLFFMFVRIGVNFSVLILISGVLCDRNEVSDGIFGNSLGWIVRNGRTVRDSLIRLPMTIERPLFTAFEGRGITLGGG